MYVLDRNTDHSWLFGLLLALGTIYHLLTTYAWAALLALYILAALLVFAGSVALVVLVLCRWFNWNFSDYEPGFQPISVRSEANSPAKKYA